MTKLPAYDAVNHKYIDPSGSYQEYKIWRKGEGYKVWLRKQWRIQNGRCAYCRISLHGKRHVVEHIIPQHTQGKYVNQGKNLVLSCSDCNKRKGGKILKKSNRSKIKQYEGVRL